MDNSKKNDIYNDIKYLAIGDDFSTGFSAFFDNQYIGNYNNTEEKIDVNYGTSFGDYLNEYFLINNNDIKVEWFYNYSINFSSVIDYLYLLKVDREIYSYDEIEKTFLFNYLNSKDFSKSNVYWNSFTDKFGLNKEKIDIDESKISRFNNLIENANLITINLGFNDLFWYIPLEKIISNFIHKRDVNEILNCFWDEFIIKQDHFIQNYKKLITEIQNRNKTCNIVLIGNPEFFIRINSLLKIKMDSNSVNILNNALDSINQSLKTIAYMFDNVYFVDAYDKDFFVNHAKALARCFIDYHPSYMGYKKMARDTFLKLTATKEDLQDKLCLSNLQSDFGYIRPILKYKNLNLNNAFYSNDFIFKVSNNEKNFLIYGNNIAIRKSLIILSSVDSNIIWRFWSIIFAYLGIYNEQVAKNLIIFLETDDVFLKISKDLIRSGILDSIVKKSQFNFDFTKDDETQKIENLISSNNLKKVIRNNSLTTENAFNLINVLYKEIINESNLTSYKVFLFDNVKILLNDDDFIEKAVKKYANYIINIFTSKVELSNILNIYKRIVNSKSLDIYLKKICSLFFDYYIEYSKFDRWNDLFAHLTSKNLKILVMNTIEFITNILNMENMINTLNELIFKISKYKVKDEYFILNIWNIFSNDKNLIYLIFKLLDNYSLNFKYAELSIKENIIWFNNYAKKNYLTFFKYFYSVLKSAENIKDFQFLVFAFVENPKFTQYFKNIKSYSNTFNKFSFIDVFKSKKYIIKTIRIFSAPLYTYCVKTNNRVIFKKLIVNSLVNILDFLSLKSLSPKSKTVFLYTKKNIYKAFKTKNKEQNLFIKSVLAKYQKYDDLISYIDKFQ